MEKKIIEPENNVFKIHGVKCDYCDWNDMSIPFEDYPQYVNAPCPKCGTSPLLTSKEYIDGLKMYKAFEIAIKINSVFKWINPFHYWRLLTGKKAKINHVIQKIDYRKGTPNHLNQPMTTKTKFSKEEEDYPISYMSALTKIPLYIHEQTVNKLQSQINILKQENLKLTEHNLRLYLKNVELLEKEFKHIIKTQHGK